MGWDLSSVPDPQDPATFAMSKLDWSEPEGGRHALLLSVYRSLAQLRKQLPELTDPDLRNNSCQFDEKERWFVLRRGRVAVVVNFGSSPVTVDLGADHEVLWATPAGASAVRRGVELPPHAGAVLVPLP
jgi:1,4-alpha-glucan branching enzyme